MQREDALVDVHLYIQSQMSNQVISQMNVQSNPVSQQPFPPTSVHLEIASDTSVDLSGRSSVCISTTLRVGATTDWKECTSLDGRKYFYNTVTKQSQWIIPEEVKRARELAEKASCMTKVDGIYSVSVSVSDVKTPSNSDAKSSTLVLQSIPATVRPVSGGTATPSRPSPHSSSLPPRNSGVQIEAVNVQSNSESRKGGEMCTTEVDGISSVSVSVSDVKTPSNSDAKSSIPVIQSIPTTVRPVSGGTATPIRTSPQSSSLPRNSGVEVEAVNVQSNSELRKGEMCMAIIVFVIGVFSFFFFLGYVIAYFFG